MERHNTRYRMYRPSWKVLLLVLALFYLSPGSSLVYAQRQEDKFFYSKFGPNAYIGYLSYVPKDYAANPDKKYPLVLFLHGSGEKAYMATDKSYLGRVTTHGPPKLIRDGKEFPFIVISPQCPFDSWDHVTTDNYATSEYRPGEFVDEILEKIKSEYRVDLDRIYITGLSMGAAATWTYLMEHPEKIAAAVPIAGWIDNQTKVCNIASNNIPIRTFIGSRDPRTEGTPPFVAKINACVPAPNPPAELTIYDYVGHDAWTRTYNNFNADNIYDWMLSFSKKRTVTAIEEVEMPKGSSISVYPLPASNSLTVHYPSKVTESVQIRLLDETTNVSFEKAISIKSGSNTFELDVSELTNGIYFLNITGAGQTKTEKIVISK